MEPEEIVVNQESVPDNTEEQPEPVVVNFSAIDFGIE